MYLAQMHEDLSRTMDPIRMQKIALFFQENFDAEVASMLLPGPAGIFPNFQLQPRMVDIDLDREKARRGSMLDPAFSALSEAEVLELLAAGAAKEILEGLLVYLPPPAIPAISPMAVETLERVQPSLLKLFQLRVITTREVNADLERDSSEIQQQRLKRPNSRSNSQRLDSGSVRRGFGWGLVLLLNLDWQTGWRLRVLGRGRILRVRGQAEACNIL